VRFDSIYYLKAFQKFPEEGGSAPGQAIDGWGVGISGRERSSALFDRKIMQRRPAFEMLDENLADTAGAGNRRERGDYKSHKGARRHDEKER
jgi:hypothetical protein